MDDEELRIAWYARAKETTLETLPAFLAELAQARSNYNTSGYAVAAAAVAASYAMNSVKGLSGFQADFVMWEYMEHWNGIKGPAKLINYDKMLYPQYESEFAKTFSDDTWIWIQKQAHESLREWEKGNSIATTNVVNHWLKIAAGKKPFGFVTKEEQDSYNAPPALRTDSQVLAAWKAGKLVLKDQ